MQNQKIGAFIAALRKEQNLTQEQFAEKLGVSNRSVSRWENGNTLPDISLMYSICAVTGVTLSELLSGARQEEAARREAAVELVLSLADRERQEKTKRLNLWFSLGLAALLGAIPAGRWLTPFHSGIFAAVGIVLHGIGFFHNNRNRAMTPREKAVLTAAGEEVRMEFAEEMVQYAKKHQKASLPQYKAAFGKIAEQLNPGEYVLFSMVAEEFGVNGAPGIWHAGIAVTRERVFLCGETAVGRAMTRTVMNIYDKAEIREVRYENRRVLLKTDRDTVRICGEHMELLADAFQNAVAG